MYFLRQLTRQVLTIGPWSKSGMRKFLSTAFGPMTAHVLLSPVDHFGVRYLDTIVCDRIGGSKKRGFYVELGANNGLAQSNTLHLEVAHRWQGILIEPVPAEFASLLANRGRRNQCVNVAAVSFGYKAKVMRIVESGLMSTPVDGSSDIKDPKSHASSMVSKNEESHNLDVIEVPVATLDVILTRNGAPKIIDFLSLDVEGGELEVLKGVDFSRTTIRWILVESRGIRAIREFLEPLGYVFEGRIGIHDYLFRSEKEVP